MSSQTGPVEGERASGAESGDEHTDAEGVPESEATCAVCHEPLGDVPDRLQEGPIHRECEPVLRCGIPLGSHRSKLH
jgi:hypothetical protein